MAPLAVDPAALDGAGASVVSVGEGLGSVISTLTGALAGCSGMAGADPAGGALGRSYDGSAATLVEAMVATRNGLCGLGDGVRMSAHNYSLAEALSDMSGRSGPLPVPPSTGPVSAGCPPSAVGTTDSAPPGWGWVTPYIGMIWPSGDSAKLRAAAAAWSAAATKFAVTEALGVGGVLGPIRAQQIPEGEAIDKAFTDAYASTTAIAGQCQTVAAQLTSYAASIDGVHAAILDLLARICDPLTGVKEVWDFLTDKDEDEIKKIADDIRAVVNNFTAEVDALRHQIAATLSEATTIATTMSRYAATEWDQFLHGTEVGRAANQVGQFGKGFGEEVGGLLKDNWTYGPLRASIDPKGWYHSWEQMIGGMAPLVGAGGEHAPGIGQSWKDLGKGVTHWDEWKTNPAEAAGKSAFDIATLFAPGGAAAKAGKGATAAAEAAKAAKAGAESTAREGAEAAASRALGDAAKAPGAPPASGPPRVEKPPAEGAPLLPDKPPVPALTKPSSAPTDGQLPHSPTESKAPAAERPGNGETPRAPEQTSPGATEPRVPTGVGEPAPTPAGHHQPVPAQARDHAPSLSGEPSASAPAQVPGSPHSYPAEPVAPNGHSPQPAPVEAPTPAHRPLTEPPAQADRPPEPPPPQDGEPSGGGQGPARDHHGPADGGGPHDSHPSGDGSPTEHGSPHGDVGAVLEHPEAEIARLADGHVPLKLLDGYDPLAGRTPEEFARDFTISSPNGELRWDWAHQAPNNGFAGIPAVTDRIPKDFHLDRVGPNGGGFMSPEGTPLAERATPPGLAAQYHVFEGTGAPIPADKNWVVLHGPAKDAFGQPGGAEQWVVVDKVTGRSVSVDKLIKAEMLDEPNPPK